MLDLINKLRLLKWCLMLCILSIIFSLPSSDVYAHPGRTDSSGGHTCRTNCASWGLEYGEYHYHNGISSNSSSRHSGTSSSNKSKNHNDWTWVAILSGLGLWYGLARRKRNIKDNQKLIRKVVIENDKRSGGLVCPLCDSVLNMKNGRHGHFYGCSKYPTCKYTRSLNKKK